MKDLKRIKTLLDKKYAAYCNEEFVALDPVQIPHFFTKKEDIEIAGFLSASIAWGQRPVILKNAKHLMQLMEYEPYDFIMNHRPADRIGFSNFRHRTMLPADILFFLTSLQNIYRTHKGLEKVFTTAYKNKGIKHAITQFHATFFEIDHPHRTRKHIANPAQNSAAKRINMFLRWMVRKDASGIDFGIWKKIAASDLMLPLDVHTAKYARKLGILDRKYNDWPAVEEVTSNLRKIDPDDPVKYDFALFGMGAFE